MRMDKMSPEDLELLITQRFKAPIADKAFGEVDKIWARVTILRNPLDLMVGISFFKKFYLFGDFGGDIWWLPVIRRVNDGDILPGMEGWRIGWLYPSIGFMVKSNGKH